MYNKIISATSDEELCLTTEELKITYDELVYSEDFTDIITIVEHYIKICAISKKLCILLVNDIDEYTKYFMTYIKYNQQLLNLDDYMREETTFNTIMSLTDDLGSLSNVYDIIPNDKSNNVEDSINDILDDIELEFDNSYILGLSGLYFEDGFQVMNPIAIFETSTGYQFSQSFIYNKTNDIWLLNNVPQKASKLKNITVAYAFTEKDI